jgi:hypothetical protein
MCTVAPIAACSTSSLGALASAGAVPGAAAPTAPSSSRSCASVWQQHRRARIGALRQALAQPLAAQRQPLALHRLEQVVDRLRLKRLHRVFVIGRDEHEQGEVARSARRLVWPILGERLRDFEAAQTGHANVEETNCRLLRQGLFERLGTVADAGNDAQLRPELRKVGLKRARQQGFVLGDERGRGHAAAPALSSGSMMRASTPPSASVAASSVNAARSPYRTCRRS